MKKIGKKVIQFCFLFFLILSLTLINFLYAQDNTKDSTYSADKKIEEFKEKIATKVAQLQEKENNKAISGFIVSKGNDSLKIITENNDEITVKIDEIITKYYQIKGNKLIEINFSDLEKNDFIIVLGLINNKEINANIVYKDENYLIFNGKIIEVNNQNYYIKVLTEEKEELILDIETNTKRLILNIKNLQLEKIGFSKIKEGDTIHFIIKKSTLEKRNRYSAEKIIIIPQEFFLLPSK